MIPKNEMSKSEKFDWKRAKSIAYFSDLKINRIEDLEYIYTVKHLVDLYSQYRTCSSLIKKEKDDLLADKKEYISAINELKNIASQNLHGKDKNLWTDIMKILEKGDDHTIEDTEQNKLNEEDDN